MNWRTALAHKEGVPKRRWPERVNRAVVVFAVAALLVGTPIVSINAFSKHLDTQTIVVEPLSYRVIHFGFYGYGKLDYAYKGISESPILFLKLDRVNFYRFQAEEDYDSLRSTTVRNGSGGGGGSSGSMWETYIVFVNEGTEPAALQFAAEAEVFFSLPVALIMLGVVATVGYAVERNSAPRRPQEAGQISHRIGMTERRKAVIAAAGLVALLTAIVVIIGLIISFGGLGWSLRLWFGTIVCTAIVFALRFKLSIVNGDPDVVLASLAHRLRVSGYRVSESLGQLSVQVSSTSAIRVFVRPVSEGTLLSYRAAGTSRGYVVLIILVLAFSLAPMSLALALFMLYRSSVFASDRIIPRLFHLPVLGRKDGAADTRMMLVAGLSEGRRISAEAYEAARAKYHAWTLVMLIVTAIAFAQTYRLMPWSMTDEASFRYYRLLVALMAGVVASLVYWGFVSRRLRPMISELKAWTTRLETALSREVAGAPPTDGEPSSFELIAESYGEVPKWLRTRRKGGMFRRPGYWFLLLFLSFYALSAGISGILFLLSGRLNYVAVFFALFVTFGSLAVFMYLRWRKRQEKEDTATMTDQTGRLQTLKAEMETFLGSV